MSRKCTLTIDSMSPSPAENMARKTMVSAMTGRTTDQTIDAEDRERDEEHAHLDEPGEAEGPDGRERQRSSAGSRPS